MTASFRPKVAELAVAGGPAVRRPSVVLGVDERRAAGAGDRAHEQAGLRGRRRGVGVHDVERALVDQAAQPAQPAGVDVARRRQVVGRHPERLELGHEVALVGQQVGGLVGDAVGVGDRGVGDQQPFGATGTEALRQPEHPQGASGHGLSVGDRGCRGSRAGPRSRPGSGARRWWSGRRRRARRRRASCPTCSGGTGTWEMSGWDGRSSASSAPSSTSCSFSPGRRPV